jgi:hypothetical protein
MNVFQKQRQFLSLESAAPGNPKFGTQTAPGALLRADAANLARSPQHAEGVGEPSAAMVSGGEVDPSLKARSEGKLKLSWSSSSTSD